MFFQIESFACPLSCFSNERTILRSTQPYAGTFPRFTIVSPRFRVQQRKAFFEVFATEEEMNTTQVLQAMHNRHVHPVTLSEIYSITQYKVTNLHTKVALHALGTRITFSNGGGSALYLLQYTFDPKTLIHLQAFDQVFPKGSHFIVTTLEKA
jgi:hypothetical protein